ncbi:MAG: 3-phosphoshikimate 1-carboxyvinyltransferase [Anaerolineae bacterium]
MRQVVNPARVLQGEASVPGDKSITHRAILFGAIATAPSRISGFLDSGVCRASIAAVEALGITVLREGADTLVVQGRGLDGISEPVDVVDCAGSGTTMRFLAGLLASYDMTAVLTGNEALRRRPMGRIIEPLRAMGATVLARGHDRFPPVIVRGSELHGIEYTMPVASAQVKSCLLLAGLRAKGPTTVWEPALTRDHSERMLSAMGVSLKRGRGTVTIEPAVALAPLDITVPGDLSSAAFLVAAGLLVPGSSLRILNVGVNPTRTGFLDIVQAMGGQVSLDNERDVGGEPVADVWVQQSPLRATTVAGDLVPLAIDELPLVAVLATQAEGVTEVRDAAELRVKESDRVATLVGELRKMGARIEELPDGYIVEGPTRLQGAMVQAHGDHRLAMALAVAALIADCSVTIEGAEYVGESYPGFFETLAGLQQ